MNHQETLNSLENQIITVTNGMFFISGSLIKENNTFYLFVTEQIGKSFANIGFTVENVESINVNAEAFGKNADGIIIKAQKYQSMYVAFEPTQIKSIDNSGAFDPANRYPLQPGRRHDARRTEPQNPGAAQDH